MLVTLCNGAECLFGVSSVVSALHHPPSATYACTCVYRAGTRSRLSKMAPWISSTRGADGKKEDASLWDSRRAEGGGFVEGSEGTEALIIPTPTGRHSCSPIQIKTYQTGARVCAASVSILEGIPWSFDFDLEPCIEFTMDNWELKW